VTRLIRRELPMAEWSMEDLLAVSARRKSIPYRLLVGKNR
jgi:hypothetical protein